MTSINRLFFLCFTVLCLFKAVGVIQESLYPWYEQMPMALTYAAMFGSPQLKWAFVCRSEQFSSTQVLVTAFAVVSFVVTSVFFGSFPGVERPRWGGEGHFEVPIALGVEWLIAGVLLLAFRNSRRVQ